MIQQHAGQLFGSKSYYRGLAALSLDPVFPELRSIAHIREGTATTKRSNGRNIYPISRLFLDSGNVQLGSVFKNKRSKKE